MNIKLVIAILAGLGLTAVIGVTVYVVLPDDSGKRLNFEEKEETIIGNEEPAGLPER